MGMSRHSDADMPHEAIRGTHFFILRARYVPAVSVVDEHALELATCAILCEICEKLRILVSEPRMS